MDIQTILKKELKGVIATEFFDSPPVECAFDNIELQITNEHMLKKSQQPIADPGWERLHAFQVNIHPHNLMVLTDAEEKEMRLLVKTWDCEKGNIEEHIHNMGFFAIAGQATKTSFDI